MATNFDIFLHVGHMSSSPMWSIFITTRCLSFAWIGCEDIFAILLPARRVTHQAKKRMSISSMLGFGGEGSQVQFVPPQMIHKKIVTKSDPSAGAAGSPHVKAVRINVDLASERGLAEPQRIAGGLLLCVTSPLAEFSAIKGQGQRQNALSQVRMLLFCAF